MEKKLTGEILPTDVNMASIVCVIIVDLLLDVSLVLI
jgi:hypothetical protein